MADTAKSRELNQKGNDLLQAGKYAEAAEAYTEALTLDPWYMTYPREPGIIRANLGYCLFLMAQYDEAAAAYHEAIEREPRRPTYHNELGDTYARIDDWPNAVAAYTRAAQLDRFGRTYTDRPGLIHFNLGKAQMRVGDVQGAYQNYIAAVRREPQNAAYQQALDTIRIEAERAVSPADSVNLESTVRAFFQELGNLDKAGPTAPSTSVAARSSRNGTPNITFADVGGCSDVKETLRKAVRLALERDRAATYGIALNGILLHGPSGSGKTFLVEATAGEFGLPLFKISIADVISKWVGEGVENLHGLFERAAGHLPCVLFFDELDSLAARAQKDTSADNRRLTETLIQHIDAYRLKPGLVLMAATSQIGEIDKSVIRSGRFDWHLKLDPPDDEGRKEILVRQLAGRPTDSIDYDHWTIRTKSWSAADLTRLVNAAALAAFSTGEPIREAHISEAIEAFEATERLTCTHRTWDEIVLDPAVREEFSLIQHLLEDPDAGAAFGLTPPRGAVLHGPPGTGKTTLARVLAHEARCSFYAMSPSDIYSKWAGESERHVAELFERARANRPSIIFLDEADALFARRSAHTAEAAPHTNHVVNQFLSEMDGVRPTERVFILAATNRLDLLDPAILRAGRLSEKIHLPLPGLAARRNLFDLFTKRIRMAPEVDLTALAEHTAGASGADIEELCRRAIRQAFVRCLKDPRLSRQATVEDFELALAGWRSEANRSLQPA